MKDIIPKSMKDVVKFTDKPRTSSFENDILRRPKMVPEPRPVNAVIAVADEHSRIEKSPFFEKRLDNGALLQNTQNTKKISSGQAAKHASSHMVLWFFVALILLGVGFAIANYFSSATVDITPITRGATINYDFTAVALEASKENDLIFNFATSTEEKTKDVPATIEKKIQKKASGKVVIFNAYNSESQRLIKNTRLEDIKTHKIFRIDESVVVPGAKIVGGKVVEPGSVLAIVYADATGKEYNIGLADFTIPGFKGDPRYAKFYAHSKADSPIGGGFSDTVKVPSDEEVQKAQEELKQALKKISVEKARAQIPDKMSLFPGSIIIKFEEVPQDPTTGDTSKVSMRATVSVFFFDTELLIQKLAEMSIPEYKGNLFSIPNMSTLTFSFIDPVDNVVLSDLTKIRFHLAGDTVFVGNIDEQRILTALLGKEKKDFGKIVIGEQNVGRAEAVVRPMWNTVFPNDPSGITIRVHDK